MSLLSMAQTAVHEYEWSIFLVRRQFQLHTFVRVLSCDMCDACNAEKEELFEMAHRKQDVWVQHMWVQSCHPRWQASGTAWERGRIITCLLVWRFCVRVAERGTTSYRTCFFGKQCNERLATGREFELLFCYLERGINIWYLWVSFRVFELHPHTFATIMHHTQTQCKLLHPSLLLLSREHKFLWNVSCRVFSTMLIEWACWL